MFLEDRQQLLSSKPYKEARDTCHISGKKIAVEALMRVILPAWLAITGSIPEETELIKEETQYLVCERQ